MRKAVACLLLIAIAGALWWGRGVFEPEYQPPAVDVRTLRTVAEGQLIGFADESYTYAWLGIPYAEPPVGERRWRAGAPARPWSGTFEALGFGPPCPQIASMGNGAARRDFGKVLGNEDCLTLNVWAPRFPGDSGARLPVMVWIHGGGNVNGSSALYPFIRNLAQPYKLIMVSINYRLGLLGWFRHPALYDEESSAEDRSGNYGTLDILLALRWIQENIESFGGDPARVTVAGGFHVYSLLVAPAARGLFQGAIAQSGGLGESTLAQAEHYRDDPEPGHERSAREVVNQLLMADGEATDREQAKALQNGKSASALRAYLYGKTPSQLLATLAEDVDKTIIPPTLFNDGAVLPREDMLTLLREGRYAPVPFIAGSNRDETKPFNLLNPEFGGLRFGVIPYVRNQAEFDRVSAYGSLQWKLFAVDQPLTALSVLERSPAFGYRFDWDDLLNLLVLDMSRLLGAAHAGEINFVFNATQPPYMIGTFYNNGGLPARSALAHAMSSYWAEFAYTGKPGRGREGKLPEWLPWEYGAGRFMVFDNVAGGVRMSSDVVTEALLQQRLLKDRAKGLIDSDQQLCRWYAELFVNSRIPSAPASTSDYETFADGVCAVYPAAEFPGLRTL